MFKTILSLMLALALPVLAFGTTDDQADGTPKPVKVITDASIVAFNYWSSDTVYNLSGFCYVDDGEVLVIEAGTVIKGDPGQGEDATALIVGKGGKIYAEGTICDPIVFTSISDDVDIHDDIPLNSDDARGLWGGMILLGEARLPGHDCPTTERIGNIEGLPVETRTEYGGCDDADNSGVLKYVSVRHAGSQLLEANEINGISFGAVGSSTVVDHVEVIYNLDDGFEWFGGTVSCYHLIGAFCGDDVFDFDEGFRGVGQFWLSVMDTLPGDRSGEHDGTWGGELGTCPRSAPVVSNVTYIGRGVGGTTNRCLEMRDNFSGAYYNSVFTDHATYGLNVEHDTLGSTRDNLYNGNLKFNNNVWYGFGNGNTSNDIANGVDAVDSILFHTYDPCDYWLFADPCPWGTGLDNHNYLSTTDVVNSTGTRLPDGSLDPRPANTGSWFCNDNSDSWAWVDPFDADDFVGYHVGVSDPDGCLDDGSYRNFEVVDYAGAFDPSRAGSWAHYWSALDLYGYLYDAGDMADCDCATDDEGLKPIKVITDDSIGTFNVWTSDYVWNIQGFCFVDSGETLIIEPGTIIKGNPGQAEDATALIVGRWGKIYALGSRCCPVIFTGTADIVDYTDDVPFGEGGRGLWGGVILLGNAIICDTLNGNVEGLPVEDRTLYGGSDDFDNSGVMKYVSIRHGGSQLLEANEINGLTMGAVGCGTVINHIEVLYNLDDGYEWFGGSVVCNNLIAAFPGDDSFDYDECYRGGGQFWFSIAEDSTGDRGGEHDGGYGSDVAACPVGTPLISNATYVGRGSQGTTTNRALEIRDAAGGAYFNSVFAEHATYGINIEKKDTEDIDSRTRLYKQQLVLYNNVWAGFGQGNTSADIANYVDDVDTILFYTHDQSTYDPLLPSAARNNMNYLSTAPVIRCDDRGQNNSLDPRAYGLENTYLNDDAGATWTLWADPNVIYTPELSPDPFCGVDVPCWNDMMEVDYPGAFDPSVSLSESWAAGWSFLWCGDVLGDAEPCVSWSTSCCELRGDINHDGVGPDIADLVHLVSYMFQPPSPAPVCEDPGPYYPEADINGDFVGPDIADLVHLVSYMFQPPSPAPVDCP